MARLRWLTTATGRVGYAVDHVLFYAKGGVARVGTSHPFVSTGILSDNVKIAVNGTVFGGGIEWAFAPQWSAKIEYDHINLGNTSAFYPVLIAPFQWKDQHVDIVLIGLNYRFGDWGKAPVVAKY